MTSLLRTKRPTTVRAASAPATRGASAVVVGLLLAAAASAQEKPAALPPIPPLPPSPWQVTAPPVETLRRPVGAAADGAVRTLLFHKEAGSQKPAIDARERETRQTQETRPDVEQYQATLEPPTFERLIQSLQSEENLRERMRQEGKDQRANERAAFPEDKTVTDDRFAARTFPRQRLGAEPYYVCYRALYFEEKNEERYGWDLGVVQPFLSAAYFYKDLATLPYQCGKMGCDKCDSGAGECLPGDPVPYLLRPPGLSARGALAEAGAVLGLIAIFP